MGNIKLHLAVKAHHFILQWTALVEFALVRDNICAISFEEMWETITCSGAERNRMHMTGYR